MTRCRNCGFIKWYFLVIVVAAFTLRFYPQYSAFINSFFLIGIPLLSKKTPEQLGFKNFKSGILWGLAASVTVLPVYALVLTILGAKFLLPNTDKLLNLLSFYFVVALSEETFFRGYFYSEMENEPFFLFISKNNFVSSFLFATAHAFIYYNPIMFKVFFPSLIMGWLYEKSGSIFAPVIFHWLSDVIYALIKF
ncbi:hypothetical protein SAMN06265339_0089 [Desulfurobacterium pacificum]|uniref:CAAX prenyl protease 2/Lysostaphin resistance protein A-like domain-containing protein n=1 Tax=Desulfurobacterium pacificum TaxID=240166 RepID=A0ABY1N874_9BACT|nr:CPBP family intramembrane glutamic endopeptidase [Desulfurobacterium pacificum]SMP03042.1 hypothetical protein SAMN06265339_0089 [Desulfurobacterium pacificum]